MVAENNSIQSSSSVETKKLDTSLSINLRPPPVDRNKSFDDEDSTRKPTTVKKSTVVVPSNVRLYSVADLQIATGSFSVDNLLGEGTFGRVYRAEFDDGKVKYYKLLCNPNLCLELCHNVFGKRLIFQVLAVKKIDSSALPHGMTDDFIEMVSKIANLDHPNVTKLVGYCAEHGQHLVVYEFHKNGSLHDFLHLSEEESKALVWNSRVKIALGTARSLE